MCQTPDWSVGDRYLRENVPELAPLVDRYSPCPLKPSLFYYITDRYYCPTTAS